MKITKKKGKGGIWRNLRPILDMAIYPPLACASRKSSNCYLYVCNLAIEDWPNYQKSKVHAKFEKM